MRLSRRIRKALQAGLARVLGAVAAALARRPRLEAGNQPTRILVIRVDERVGNVLLTTPLLRALQMARPEARIEVLVAASKASILTGIADTIPFEKKELFRNPIRFMRRLWALRAARYDAVLDASHWHHFSFTSALLMGFIGAPLRITHERGAAARFATHAVAPPSAAEWEVATKLRLLAPLGHPSPEPPPLETGLGRGEAEARMRSWIDEAGLDPARLVGLAPGARKLDHRTPPELFAALGDQAASRGHGIVVLWGPGEESLVQAVQASCPSAIAAPPTNLDELAALMRACRVVVANDTGPMHLAVACGARTLGLFRGADPIRWGHTPLGHAVVVVPEEAPEDALPPAREALDRLL
ncbi:MAG: glycosyltransferase family 9 protein [Deltaproteobacteria bacterium]|nr:glycosyltransferase family 9 protein [Deltaproteobacteria bacterium]